jgi:AI-2 transport protein TqsA
VTDEGYLSTRSWVRFALEQVGLGVLVGVGIGLAGGWLVAWASRKGWMTGPFQRLALLALALISRAMADQIGGNGFIAAFVGGLAVGPTVKSVGELLIRFTEAEGQLLSLSVFFVFGALVILLAEGPAMMDRLRAGASGDNPQVERLTTIGRSVVRQFGLRAIVNLVTGAGVTVLLFLLGVDFPLLWGILTFFLSFVPYIGLVLAVTPAVVLALAEFGVSRAVLVIAGVIVINILAENVLSPMMMGRGLNISPTIVFLSFVFWAWLLGDPAPSWRYPLPCSWPSCSILSLKRAGWRASLACLM